MIRASYLYHLLTKLYRLYESSFLVVGMVSIIKKIEDTIKTSGLFGALTHELGQTAQVSRTHKALKLPSWVLKSQMYQLMLFLLVEDHKETTGQEGIVVTLHKWALMVFVGILPIIQFHKFSYEVIIFSLPLLVLFLKRRRPLPRHMLLYSSLFVVMLFLSTVFSVATLESFEVFSAYVFFFSVFLFTMAYFNLRDLKIITAIAVFSGAVIGLLGIYQYFFADMAQLESWVDIAMNPNLQARAYGTFGDPNSFAIYMIPILMFGLYHIIVSKHVLRKLLFMAMTGVCAVAVVLTFSRSAWIGVAVAMVLLVTLYQPKWLFGGLVFGSAAFLVMPAVVTDRIFSIVFASRDTSMIYREDIWAASFRMIRDFGFSGLGLGYHPFGILGTQYQYRGIYSLHTHNLYLQWIVETGYIGLAAFLLLIFAALCLGLKVVYGSDHTQIKLMATVGVCVLMSYLVIGIVEYSFLYMRNVFMLWLCLSIIVVAYLEHKKTAS